MLIKQDLTAIEEKLNSVKKVLLKYHLHLKKSEMGIDSDSVRKLLTEIWKLYSDKFNIHCVSEKPVAITSVYTISQKLEITLHKLSAYIC